MEAQLFWVIFITLVLSVSGKQTYIVQMKHNSKPSSFASHSDWYSANLRALSGSDSTSDALLYTYDAAYHGFAASLSPEQADALRQSEHVVGVYEDTVYELHTTRTPEFLGLESSAAAVGGSLQYLNQATGDVIIGVLDTGVWPESRSFNDNGMPEVPTRWTGECESGIDFSPNVCNKKLIGARSFSRGYRMATGGGYLKKPREVESPRDHDGHGTHTATTAAGSMVANASLLGYATGTARGMAPYARVASYKVCWPDGCFGSDILAGIDHAILDRVDVLSISLGGGSAPYFRDTIAIGAFTAVDRGIFVSCSAGNNGPNKASLANTAPWAMTVGAGTLDRDFPAYASLGNLNKFTGVSLYSGPGMGTSPVGLVYNNGTNSSSSLCLPGSLEPLSVRGKVVVCDRGVNARVEKGGVVRSAGGVGMILANTAASGEEMVADSHLLPTVAVGKKVGDMIKNYAASDIDPTAVISFGGTVLNVKPSPVVAAFSSRGPNLVVQQILKPDVIGPGVNILAAWSESIGPTGLEEDIRKSKFNIMSGTSMSCPHISGLAALLKAAHPDWSPSAIKSALMTTAYTVDNTRAPLSDAAGGQFSNPWAHGSGHVDPARAVSPGLVYDISTEDYVAFLCSLGYTLQQVQAIAKSNVTCARRYYDPGQLNYPSFSVLFGNRRAVRYTRELTNVGAARSLYKVIATGPPGVRTIVKPSVLYFPNVGDKRKYTVTFVSAKVSGIRTSRSEFGSIVWANAMHLVKSPVAFAWTLLGS